MANLCVENDDFYDAPEEITSDSDSPSEDSEDSSCPECQLDRNSLESFHYNFWAGNPKSVDERRDEFIRQTGFELERCLTAREALDESIFVQNGNEMTTVTSAPALRNTDNDEENNISTDETEFTMDHQVNNGEISRKHIIEKHSIRRESEFESDLEGMRKVRRRKDWFKKLGVKASNMFSKERENRNSCNYKAVFGPKSERIRVRSQKKWSKELSSLYRIQDFCAHKGCILSIKFNHDGQHLATGGEDGSLYIWKVIEDERSSSSDFLRFSSELACLYFSINGISDFASFLKIKEERNIIDKLKNFLDSACIMLPQKVFHIVEKPLQDLQGHEGEILDITWSKEGYLLSSSDDKTVRLWQLGCNQCLRVFPHTDYVTCAQFSPSNNNHFISGSIDGIVRIWEVHGCCVVDWIDFKEIVTAICYQPDGKGGIVGSMAGSCSFFGISGIFASSFICANLGPVLLSFSPIDPSVVLVSSADAQVRILRNANLVCKLRGSFRDAKDGATPMIASFTSDGNHIISANHNSDVYIWNYLDNERAPKNKVKTIRACESFRSEDTLTAVPWQGFRPSMSDSTQVTTETTQVYNNRASDDKQEEEFNENNQSLTGEFGTQMQSNEGIQRINPTIVLPVVGKIDYELLKKVCESILSGSHMLGLVIVTAGKDGRIKTFHNYGLPIQCSTRKPTLNKLGSSKHTNVSSCSF